MNKYRPNDPKVLNYIDEAPESAKQYHDMRAAEEISKLVAKYKDAPAYLRLLSLHLNGASEKIYSKHMQELEKSKPQRRNPDNGRFESEELFDGQD